MTKKYIQILIISLVLLASFGCGKKEEYREFKSPDGKYKIIVFYHPSWFAVSPGQAGDNPGTIQLQDERGKVLKETEVEMVQLVDNVEWQDKKVYIKLLVDWDLPN